MEWFRIVSMRVEKERSCHDKKSSEMERKRVEKS
jgi:hypothetical protein